MLLVPSLIFDSQTSSDEFLQNLDNCCEMDFSDTKISKKKAQKIFIINHTSGINKVYEKLCHLAGNVLIDKNFFEEKSLREIIFQIQIFRQEGESIDLQIRDLEEFLLQTKHELILEAEDWLGQLAVLHRLATTYQDRIWLQWSVPEDLMRRGTLYNSWQRYRRLGEIGQMAGIFIIISERMKGSNLEYAALSAEKILEPMSENAKVSFAGGFCHDSDIEDFVKKRDKRITQIVLNEDWQERSLKMRRLHEIHRRMVEGLRPDISHWHKLD